MQSNNNCRVCGHSLEKEILFLEEMPLTDEFVQEDSSGEYIEDIHIYQCKNCFLVQNPHDMDYSHYYQGYEYSSGHSKFTQNFMEEYARITMNEYSKSSGFLADSVIEVGSGDGVQLQYFSKMGVGRVLGVEPSELLVNQSERAGVPAVLDLFTYEIVDKIPNPSFDICISSYTLDHVPDPVDYLKSANKLLKDKGILAFEVHDLEDISDRSEWCLFEHEHTIYLDEFMAKSLVESFGFKVISINPISKKKVRANSLIVIAQKERSFNEYSFESNTSDKYRYQNLENNIVKTIENVDSWILKITKTCRLIGWGVGGRGVMTLAAIKNYCKFETIIDSNHSDKGLLTPKTRIPISSVKNLGKYKDGYCLVFSFGYIDEIRKALLESGFEDRKIISLDYFYK